MDTKSVLKQQAKKRNFNGFDSWCPKRIKECLLSLKDIYWAKNALVGALLKWLPMQLLLVWARQSRTSLP